MTFAKTLIAGACALAASAATAQTLHVNDMHYVKAARCQGLMTSSALPPIDPTGINRFMDLETAGRNQIVMDDASDARNNAKRDAATAGPDQKASLIAERDTVCRKYYHWGMRGAEGQLTGE